MDLLKEVGAIAGLASFLGLALLALLYFARRGISGGSARTPASWSRATPMVRPWLPPSGLRPPSPRRPRSRRRQRPPPRPPRRARAPGRPAPQALRAAPSPAERRSRAPVVAVGAALDRRDRGRSDPAPGGRRLRRQQDRRRQR